MKLTRRDLFRSAAALGGAAAVAGLGGLADQAVAGTVTRHRGTLDKVILKGKAGRGGWTPLVHAAGEEHVVRTGLGAPAKAGRKDRRRALLAFAQISDVHIVDAQSPLRLESGDGFVSAAYRPQEVLTAHVAEAMVREINQVGRGPVTGKRLALAIQTGDNSDNGQYNEVRWNISLLDGGRVRQDSGDLTRYEGVMDGDPAYYDTSYWHPHGTPTGKTADEYRSRFGFPTVPGLLDDCRRPFKAHGLDVEWFTALGNHDELYQGNFPHSATANAQATGTQKPTSKGMRTVSPDPDRRLLSRQEMVAEHFTTTALPGPVGHGFTQANLDAGTAYYTFDRGPVRFVVMDTVNENGGAEGSMDQTQFAWLQQQLGAATDRLVVVASHHTSWTMDNAKTAANEAARVLGDGLVAELLAHENVIAWVNGHTHSNSVRAHTRQAGGGFWEINTASHIDWPQQSRIIEVVDNRDTTLSIFTTMLDHGAPLKPDSDLEGPMKLAALGRLLAANDPGKPAQPEPIDARRGHRADRNVELLVPAPAFLA